LFKFRLFKERLFKERFQLGPWILGLFSIFSLAASIYLCLGLHIASAGAFGLAACLGFALLLLRAFFRKAYITVFLVILSLLLFGITYLLGDEGSSHLAQYSLFRDIPKKEFASHLKNICIASMIPVVSFQLIGLLLRERRLDDIEKLKVQLRDRDQKLLALEDNTAILVNNIRMLVVGYLMNLGTRLGFGTKTTNNERVTVYVVDDELNGKYFVNSGRYSKNPLFDQTGRTAYPIDQGFIGEVYRNGTVYSSSGPCPEADCASYENWHHESGLKREAARDLNMKSRFYYGYRVAQSGKTLAVIIIESTMQNRYTKSSLDGFFVAEDENLCTFFGNVRPFISVPSDAIESGF